jgi:hypothetical protein
MGRGVVIPVLAAAALACPPAADAAYVTGRQEWSVLSAAGKIGWATGFVDGALSPLDGPADPRRRRLLRCLAELGVSGAEVAGLVEDGYGDDRNAGLPAAAVAWSGLRAMCPGRVGRRGGRTGLRPLDP